MNAADDLPDDWSTLWYLVRRVAGQMDRAGESMFRTDLGISLAQYLVLSVVDAHPGELNQQTVANRLGLTKGSISRQIEAGVTAGLMRVEVSQHSRRENAVQLTAEGTALVRRGDELFQQSRQTLLDAIDPNDLTTVISTLATVTKHLESNPGASAERPDVLASKKVTPSPVR